MAGAGKVGSRRGRKHRRVREDPHYYTKAGPVRITRADGTIEEVKELAPTQLARVVTHRWHISAALRARVWERDRGLCRYCWNAGDVLDHVVPVALGGSSKYRNLVVACAGCNTDKGTQIWVPDPLTARPRRRK